MAVNDLAMQQCPRLRSMHVQISRTLQGHFGIEMQSHVFQILLLMFLDNTGETAYDRKAKR